MIAILRRSYYFCLLIALVVAATACSLVGGEAVEETAGHDVHWTYNGEEGPENWGGLSEEYTLCGTGVEQSPIDITAAAPRDVADVVFNYQDSALKIENNGHTVQVNYDTGSTIVVDGTTYTLAQFHFHAPSEHLLNGRAFPAEVHLVHKDAAGGLAVIGVLIEEGSENEALADVWAHLPATEQTEKTIDGARVHVDRFLPAERLSYRYDGSLTTPPCSEKVEWIVLTNPIQMSAAQISTFAEIVHHDNSRPPQPLNDRELAEDTSSN
jgi:carbonic anhydrase